MIYAKIRNDDQAHSFVLYGRFADRSVYERWLNMSKDAGRWDADQIDGGWSELGLPEFSDIGGWIDNNTDVVTHQMLDSVASNFGDPVIEDSELLWQFEERHMFDAPIG